MTIIPRGLCQTRMRDTNTGHILIKLEALVLDLDH